MTNPSFLSHDTPDKQDPSFFETDLFIDVEKGIKGKMEIFDLCSDSQSLPPPGPSITLGEQNMYLFDLGSFRYWVELPDGR